MTSYLLTYPELEMLLHFCGADFCRGFPLSDSIDEEEAEKIINILQIKGMVIRINPRTVALDRGIELIIYNIIFHKFLIPLIEGCSIAYLGPQFPVILEKDMHKKNSVILTPFSGLESFYDEISQIVYLQSEPISAIRPESDQTVFFPWEKGAFCREAARYLKEGNVNGPGVG